jgi:hypothetical protein
MIGSPLATCPLSGRECETWDTWEISAEVAAEDAASASASAARARVSARPHPARAPSRRLEGRDPKAAWTLTEEAVVAGAVKEAASGRVEAAEAAKVVAEAAD